MLPHTAACLPLFLDLATLVAARDDRARGSGEGTQSWLGADAASCLTFRVMYATLAKEKPASHCLHSRL